MKYDKLIVNSPAVSLQDVEVSYGIGPNKTKILKNVNIHVATGTIYGLLGPSGCGKTTLLKCVVDLLKPDKGKVRVFNQTPGSIASNIPGWKVGYTPQELAVYPELTTEETLAYFGRLHHMEAYHIRARIEFLVKFLNLSQPKKWVQCLSGGEQRRVSLAIALLHQPPLLILDEPTVGVEPILRKNIWNYLSKLSAEENVSIIITTHYVEEAKLADKVGLMREGRILAQDKPALLLEKYNAYTLEEVFIRVCEEKIINKEEEIISSNLPEFASEKKQSNLIKDLLKLPSFRRINAIIILNFILMWRNFTMLMFQFLSPTFQIILFFLSWDNPRDLHVAILNQDNILGTQYVNCINKETIHQVPVNSLDEGVNLVLNGKAWAVINIWPNFTTANIIRISSLNDVPKEIIDASTIHVRHDNTNQIIFYTLEEALFNAYGCFVKEASNNTQQLPPNPIQFGKPIYGPAKTRFANYFTPGVLVASVFCMVIASSALTFVTNKESGLLERTYISGATSFELLFGYTFTQLGIIMIQCFIVLTVAMGGFDVKNNGSPVWLYLLVLLVGLSGMSFGFLISTLANNGTTAMMMMFAVWGPILFTCGLMWPIEGMPKLLHYASKFQPLTLPKIAMSWIMSNGRDITFIHVWLGFVSSLTWTIIFLILSFIVLSIKK